MSTVAPNRAPFTAADLTTVFGADACRALSDDWRATGVVTDSRGDVRGALFVALEGDRFDGHRFAADVLAAGAAGVVVRADHPAVHALTGACVVVDDTLVALGDLARHHRRRFAGPVVAIGGAMGKTTTKELTVAVLTRRFRVHATAANNNNRIGVPLTLLQLDDRADVAVIEVGTNQPGEIAELARITEASHALLTNIAEEHLESLIDLDGVEREETALFSEAEARGAIALVNLDDARLADWSRSPHAITFGADASAAVCGHITLRADACATLTLDDVSIDLQLLGRGMARNALAAAAIGHALGVETADISAALAAWTPTVDPAGYARMALQARNGVRFLVDCYNASPAGMLEALDVLHHLPVDPPGRRIAVLGDMLELGGASRQHHEATVAHVLADPTIDAVHVLGPDITAATRALSADAFVVHDSVDGCLDALRATIRAGDVVLFKASHGIGLERVVRPLLAD